MGKYHLSKVEMETIIGFNAAEETAELDGMMKAQGISGETLKRAKAELRKDGKIIYTNRGYGKDKKYYCALASLGQSETVLQ